jgi:hypothetical protein
MTARRLLVLSPLGASRAPRLKRGRGVEAGHGVVEHDAALAGREAMLAQRSEGNREHSQRARLAAMATDDGCELGDALACLTLAAGELLKDRACGSSTAATRRTRHDCQLSPASAVPSSFGSDGARRSEHSGLMLRLHSRAHCVTPALTSRRCLASARSSRVGQQHALLL